MWLTWKYDNCLVHLFNHIFSYFQGSEINVSIHFRYSSLQMHLCLILSFLWHFFFKTIQSTFKIKIVQFVNSFSIHTFVFYMICDNLFCMSSQYLLKNLCNRLIFISFIWCLIYLLFSFTVVDWMFCLLLWFFWVYIFMVSL